MEQVDRKRMVKMSAATQITSLPAHLKDSEGSNTSLKCRLVLLGHRSRLWVQEERIWSESFEKSSASILSRPKNVQNSASAKEADKQGLDIVARRLHVVKVH